MKNNQVKPSIISGKAYWASLTTPNRLSNMWQIDVGNLDAKNKKILRDDKIEKVDLIREEKGYKPNRQFLRNMQDAREDYITIKVNADKVKNTVVLDHNCNPLRDKFIGNGSKVQVAYFPVKYNYSWWSWGVTPVLLCVKVIDLIEYGAKTRCSNKNT